MPCEALARGPTRLRKDPSHHEPGDRLVRGAPLDGKTEEKIDRTQRTRGRPGAVEDLFRKPQGPKKGAEAFEILGAHQKGAGGRTAGSPGPGRPLSRGQNASRQP